jgi:sarcosine/dimethylglycine N-methyltransferase
VRHYTRVREVLTANRARLRAHVSDAYIDRMITGLGHWIEAGRRGFLAWGILQFGKPG